MPSPIAVPLLEDLAALLTTARLGRAGRAFDEVDSTMTVAAAWAADGAPDGALVVARRQSAGRGRLGRTWTDEPGASLLFSLVLRPELPTDRLGLVPLAAGVAAAEAVERVAGLRPALKWPNDVLLDGRKAGGLLVEGQLTAGRPTTLILGAGLNVGQTAFPPELAAQATSLARAAGRAVPHAPLLAAFLGALEAWLDTLGADDGTGLRAAWEARMHGRGAPVTVSFPGTPRAPITGRALGLAPDGALHLGTDAGGVAVHAGEVTVSKG